MPDILHRICCNAAPSTVFGLLASAEGLKQWWTSDATGGSAVGDPIELGFNHRQGVIRLRIDEMTPDQHVVWTCVGHGGGMEEWPGTRLDWLISPWKNGGTELRFTHAFWKRASGEFPTCNTTWGFLMYRIKQRAEGGLPGPYFN